MSGYAWMEFEALTLHVTSCGSFDLTVVYSRYSESGYLDLIMMFVTLIYATQLALTILYMFKRFRNAKQYLQIRWELGLYPSICMSV